MRNTSTLRAGPFFDLVGGAAVSGDRGCVAYDDRIYHTSYQAFLLCKKAIAGRDQSWKMK
jgi:hypothetical protein